MRRMAADSPIGGVESGCNMAGEENNNISKI